MRIEIRAFGGLAERAGRATLIVDLPYGADVADLRRTVATTYPELADLLPRVAVSVDLELASDATVLTEGQEVALLPPVAGGSDGPGSSTDGAVDGAVDDAIDGGSATMTGLVHGRIDIDGVLARMAAPDVGAVVSFLGTVRDHADDLDDVVALEYSAYEPMAAQELARIALETRAAHPEVRGLALLHALGALEVGSHTILVAASSAHRAEAFAACSAALEAIKERVPVYKREITADGKHRWVGME